MKVKGKKLFDAIKNKVNHTPGDEFDQHFWQKFEQEFPKEKTTFFLWNPVYAVAASIIIIAGVFGYQQFDNQLSGNRIQYAAIMELEPMLENMEVLEEIDEELFELDDKEWDTLIAGDI
jgi:hypothetical protein